MKNEIIVVGSYQVNCSIYYDETSKDGVIIDPGADAGVIIQEISELGVKPLAVLLTHGHSDHIGGVREILAKFQIPLYAGEYEKELLANSTANLSAYLGLDITTPPADFWLKDEEYISIGPVYLKVFHTPGHSPGGLCFLDEKENLLFCGDTLFYGSIGRTDFPGCSHEQLINSIEKKLLPLPDSIQCIPGHGPATSIGAERVNNPYLQGGNFV